MKLNVYGKINIALNITGIKSGMHLIDTVMASVSLFDEITAKEAGEISVTCDAPISGKNIALTAAEEVYAVCGRRLAVDIKKGIPFGGGMGGSSADAAGVLAAADAMFGLSSLCDVSKLASRLGADVPYMLRGGFCRATGFGEILAPFDAPAGMRLLIAECGSVGTADCYRLSDKLTLPEADNSDVIKNLKSGVLSGSNALLPAARQLNPRIGRAEDIFAQCGGKARLTGSGGCVFDSYSGKTKAALIGAGFICHDVYIMDKGIEIYL